MTALPSSELCERLPYFFAALVCVALVFSVAARLVRAVPLTSQAFWLLVAASVLRSVASYSRAGAALIPAARLPPFDAKGACGASP